MAKGHELLAVTQYYREYGTLLLTLLTLGACTGVTEVLYLRYSFCVSVFVSTCFRVYF